MAVSIKQLSAFVSVAQSNNFAEAAEKVHLSQPALSSAIKKLEQSVGGQLFFRTTRKVELSHEGREFYPIAKRLLQDWENAVADIQNLFAMRRGRLVVAAMPSFANTLLPSLLHTFRLKWPEIDIGIEDVVMELVIEKVHQGRAELGFTFAAEQMDGLEFYPILRNEFIAVCSPDHAIANLKHVTWCELARFDFVAMNRGSAIRNWMDNFTHAKAIELNIVAQANQLSTLGECVNSHLGISVVPGICEAQFSRAGLTCIRISGENFQKDIGMVRAIRKTLSVPAQAFWDLVVERF